MLSEAGIGKRRMMGGDVMDAYELNQRRSLPLEAKINLSIQRIREWYEHWDGLVRVDFSGGKDSTVLLHLVRSLYPEVPAVFVDTGLEYPEIKQFVRSTPNIEIVRPKMSFRQVIERYGYPVVSKQVAHALSTLQNPTERNEASRRLRLEGIKKDGTKAARDSMLPKKWRYLINAPFKISDYCCTVMKKQPLEAYERRTGCKPFVGLLATESSARERLYLNTGCNAFDLKHPKSMPLAFWTEQDILQYLVRYKVPYCSVYGEIIQTETGLATTGEERTGCMFCMFGVHLKGGVDKFLRMARTHPVLYRYCMETLGLRQVLEYLNLGVDFPKAA